MSKKTILAMSVVATFVLFLVYGASSGCSSGEPGQSDSLKGDSVAVTTINSSYSMLPMDITEMSQNAADSFSWRTFIALNWPADQATCSADTTKSILNGSGPVVWETYLSDDQVFVSPGNQPASWCANSSMETAIQHLPPKVQALAKQTGIRRFIHMNAKSPSPHGLDQASGGPLVDQNGRFARYEIRMNYDEYHYIDSNSLWSKQGQKDYIAAGDTFYFPGGPTAYGPDGSIEVKAAWKVLGAGDDSTRFYTIRAIVYNDHQGDPSPGPNPVTLGLVGLHIAHKTATQFMWVWSTFEHVDNLTTSFYNPNCPACPVNQPITGSQDELDSITGATLHAPTQVTRVNAVGLPDVAGINTYFQGILHGSVWENYELIGTQWLFFENMVPNFLANSVQETYLQGPNPPSWGDFTVHGTDVYYFKDPRYKPFNGSTSSSCSGCHYTAKSQGIHSDFSFMIGEAQ